MRFSTPPPDTRPCDTTRQELDAKQIKYAGRFLISDRAHMVFDFHQAVDGYNEENLGRNKIGASSPPAV